VKTAVPFLLSSNLKMREYQHIALDWMIALHDKGLNGILADGKLILFKVYAR
jgi:SNF2 family DNA or RNA helicase